MILSRLTGARNIEILSKRTLKSKTFDIGGGLHKQAIKIGTPVHWDNAGVLEDIDTTPRIEGTEWVVDQAPYDLRIDQTRPAFTYTNASGSMTWTLTKIGGTPVNTSNMTAIEVERGIEYRGLHPGITLLLDIRGDKVEWWKTIDSPAAPKSFEWTIERDDGFDGIIGLSSAGADALDRPLDMVMDVSAEIVIAVGRLRRVMTETFNNRVSEVVDLKTRRRGWLAPGIVEYPIVIDVDVTESTGTANGDDIQDKHVGGGGNWNQTPVSADAIKLGAAAIYSSNYYYYLGLRFQTVAITNAQSISLAELKFEVIAVGAGGVDVGRLWGSDEDDAAIWASYDGPGTRTKTTAVTDITSLLSTTGSKTAICTAVIQEIVDRASWATGNDLAIILGDDGTRANNEHVTIEDSQAAGSAEATLEVTFAGGGANPHGPFGHSLFGALGGPI